MSLEADLITIFTGPALTATTAAQAFAAAVSDALGGVQDEVNLGDYASYATGNDWTVPLQMVLDLFSANHTTGLGASTGAIYVPPGTYEISDTVELVSAPGLSLHWHGFSPAETGGSKFKWTGAAGGTMMQLRGLNDSLIENIRFDANEIAKHAVRVQYFPKSGGGINGAARGLFRRCHFVSADGSGSAAFAVGDDAGGSTFQASEMMFDSCSFLGDPDDMGAGWMALEKGNVKNFWFVNCYWSGGLSAIDWRYASGTMTVIGGNVIDVGRQVLLYGGGFANFTAHGLEFEGGSHAVRFVEGSSGADVLGLGLYGCQVECICPDGTEADVAGQPAFASFLDWDPDIMIRHPGPIVVQANNFRNIRTGSSVPNILARSKTSTANGPGSVTSIGNMYLNADTWAPIIDQIGATSFLATGGNDDARFVRYYISSTNDVGGPEGAPTRLRPTYGVLPSSPLLSPKNYGNQASVTYRTEGEVRRSLTPIMVTKDCFTAAATSQTMQIAGIPARARVVSVIADVTQAFAGAGITAPLAMRLGHTSGGNEYLLDFDPSGTGQWGLVSGDLGAGLAAATAVQGGVIKSWTADTPLYLKLTTTAGNVNLLTTGSVCVYLVIELFDTHT